MVDVMRKRTKSRFILIGIVILALILCLWVIWDGPRDGPLNTTNLTPQTTSNDGAPQSGSVRNGEAERAPVRLEASRSKSPVETTPNQRRIPSPGESEKRRAVQSTITGVVASSEDGTAIQDARITVSPVGSEDVRVEAVTGQDGRFQMTVHRAGRYTLRAEADGYRRYYTRQLLISPAKGDLNHNILMTPQVEFRGRVVDRHSRGIGGASVWLREETRGPFDKKSMVKSDQSGRFLMPKPPVSGTFFAEAAHPEYELASRVPVTLPKDEEVVITMHRVPDAQLGSVSGQVWDTDGHPIHGATVNLSDFDPNSRIPHSLGESSTDLTGEFFFSRVRRGKYLISAYADGFAGPIGGQGNKILTVEPGRNKAIDLILVGQSTVQGVVLNDEGLSVAGAQVLVKLEKGTGIGAIATSDGTFKIPEVPPGRHRILVAHREYVIYESTLVAPTSQFFTITLQPGLSLSGYVMNQDNEQIREFSLRLSPAGRQHEISPFLFDPMSADITPSDGYFRVNGLTPQTYILSVSLPNAESLETRLELLESTSVTIVLNPADSDSPIRIRKSW